MKFELVRQRLRALPREMPAPPAILMPIRIDSTESLFPQRPLAPIRQAAVLVLIFPDEGGEARVLLTVRVPELSTHAGEISFPGGSAEPDDADPIATALRESAEEIGLDPEACGLQVTGALERFQIPVSGFRITPVVALAERRPICHANPAEVARIIEPPVEAFLPDAPIELEERVIRERLIRYGVYPVEGERVWGATARMLGQLGALLATVPEPEVERDAGPPTATATAAGKTAEPAIRPATPADRAAIDAFLTPLAPELARSLPPSSELLLAEIAGEIMGLAGWAPWDRPRADADPGGFDGLTFDDGQSPAELTLLAVAPQIRGQGLGRKLTDAVADAVAGGRGSRRLLAWTLADPDVRPASVAARTFFRSGGFTDVAVDRHYLAGGENRLLLCRIVG